MSTDAMFSELLRPELSELKAYVPHDPPGIEVKLDANEAPPSTSPRIREIVARAVASVAMERYPDPRALRLKDAIAKRTGAKPDDLLLGTGSDEVISLLQTALARPRRENPQGVMLFPTPTFVMYRITARGHGHKPVEVPLDASWDLDVTAMKRAIDLMQPSIVFVASPNNPTGNRVNEARLREVLSACEASGSLAIVDEAYIDYSAANASVRGWREKCANMGTLRTLSKVGLAALRIGWLEADASLVTEIDKVRQPFNVSAVSQIAAAAVLEDAWDEVQADVARVVRGRQIVADAIAKLPGFVVTPSDANFVWVKTPVPSQQIFEALIAEKILVRSFHAQGGRMASQLRITIGTDAENVRLIESFEKIARSCEPTAGRPQG